MYPSITTIRKTLDRKGRSENGFTLSGGLSLQSLALFYGLKLSGESVSTLGDYLARTCGGKPRVGDRALCDRRVELVVQEMQRGTVHKVCLRIMPGWIGERRALHVVQGRRRGTNDRRGLAADLKAQGRRRGASNRRDRENRRTVERRDVRL